MIQQLLIKYLIQNGRLGIPDIGLFQLKQIQSRVNESGELLTGPDTVIEYRTETVAADKHLFEFLSQEMEADEVAAIGSFNEWVHGLKQMLSDKQTVVLPLIGSLSQTPEGSISFKVAERTVAYKPVSLPEGLNWEQETGENEITETPADSSWWIYAIVLLLLGVAAIAYYYL